MCPEVIPRERKNARVAQVHSDAWNDIRVKVPTNFARKAGMTRRRGYAFFSELGGGRQKKNMAIPPGYRRILKKGDFNTSPVFWFSKRKRRFEICYFKTAANLYRAWRECCHTTVFFFCRRTADCICIQIYPKDFRLLRYSIISASSTVSRICCNSLITFSRSFGKNAVTG